MFIERKENKLLQMKISLLIEINTFNKKSETIRSILFGCYWTIDVMYQSRCKHTAVGFFSICLNTDS